MAKSQFALDLCVAVAFSRFCFVFYAVFSRRMSRSGCFSIFEFRGGESEVVGLFFYLDLREILLNLEEYCLFMAVEKYRGRNVGAVSNS